MALADTGTIYDIANEHARLLIRRVAFIVCLAIASLTAVLTAMGLVLSYFDVNFFSLLFLIALSLPAGFLIRAGRVRGGAILLIVGLEAVLGVEPYFLRSQPVLFAMYLVTNCLGFVMNALLAVLLVGRLFLVALVLVSAADIVVVSLLTGNRAVEISTIYVVLAFLGVGTVAYVINALFRSALASAREEERRAAALREQLLHAHKMEAVGRLAGGIAHDFNNILAAVRGQTEVLLLDSTLAAGVRGPVEDLRRYAGKGADLVKRLLLFSRREPAVRTEFDANAVLGGVESMLERILGEGVRLTIAPAGEPAVVRGDPGQFEQVVTNLVVNARDAMPHGGSIEISVGFTEGGPDGPEAQPPLAPGRYAAVSVRDAGTGIRPEILSRIFEPFFTTKPEGRGTGLGLSIVYGIVSQSGGGVSVRSAPGQGSTFTVYLPRP